MTDNEQLPHDLDAERYLLSCAFIDGPQVISDAMRLGVTADSFFDPRHAEVWRTALSLVYDGYTVDPATMHCVLKSSGNLDYIGGTAMLAQLSQYCPTTLNTRLFARTLRDYALKRALLRTSVTITEDATSQAPAESVLEDAAKRIMDLDSRQESETWAGSVDSALAHLESRVDPVQHGPEPDALSFGFSDFDRFLGQMRNGQVVVIAARPSVGKSSLARQIAMHAAVRESQQVLFCSLEVVGKSLALNMAQTLAGVSAASLGAQSHAQDVQEFRDALKAVKTRSIDVLAGSNVTLASIRARCEVLKAHGTPVRLVVIDYLQLMPDCVPAKGENRAQSVGRVSRALKAFALDANCVVLLLSQLNRESARDGREPALHDLRESGDIEQDADKVLFLHRPDTDPTTGAKQPEDSLASECPRFFVRVIQAKGRDDGTGAVKMHFRRAITRFEQILTTEPNQRSRIHE